MLPLGQVMGVAVLPFWALFGQYDAAAYWENNWRLENVVGSIGDAK